MFFLQKIKVWLFLCLHIKQPKLLPKDQLGRDGENIATKYLRKNGYQILGRNIHFKIGEIDIIAEIGRTVVFIEVKTRRSASYCHPIEAVNVKKKQKIRRMGYQYFYRKRYDPARYSIRFDIITLIWPEGETPKLEHFPGAF